MMRKVLGIFPKKPRTKETTDSSFKTTIQKAIDGEGGTVHLFRFDPENAGGLNARLSPFESDVKDWKDRDIESYLNQVHGGGRYRVRVDFKQKDGTEREAKMFDFTLAGEPKEGTYEAKKTKQAETQQVTEIFKTAMDFAKEVKGGDGNAALIQSFTAQINTLMTINADLQKQNSGNMMQMQTQYNTLVMKIASEKEAGGNLSEMIENMKDMEEFKSMLVPKMEQNETIELVRAVSPMVTALIAGQMGIQPQEPVRMMEAARPGETQDKNLVPPGSGRTELGAPQPATRGTPSVAKTEATPSEINLPNGTRIVHDDFETVMLHPLMDQFELGASPHEIALMIKTIIDWSFWRIKSGIEPHTAIIGMVTTLAQASQGKADFEAIEKAYDDFAKIVEMPQELIDPVKKELLGIYGPIFLEMQSQANPIPPGDGRTKAGGVDAELGKK